MTTDGNPYEYLYLLKQFVEDNIREQKLFWVVHYKRNRDSARFNKQNAFYILKNFPHKVICIEKDRGFFKRRIHPK